MAQEVKTIVHFKSQKEAWLSGDGLRAHADKGVCRLDLKRGKQPNCAIGLYRERIHDIPDGYRTWLLVSSVLEGSHDGWVSHYEGDTHPTLWLDECNVQVFPIRNLTRFRFGITKSHIKSALKHCESEQEQAWMISRFSPRLYPASIRYLEGKVLQLWVSL